MDYTVKKTIKKKIPAGVQQIKTKLNPNKLVKRRTIQRIGSYQNHGFWYLSWNR